MKNFIGRSDVSQIKTRSFHKWVRSFFEVVLFLKSEREELNRAEPGNCMGYFQVVYCFFIPRITVSEQNKYKYEIKSILLRLVLGGTEKNIIAPAETFFFNKETSCLL